jgi:REP-associated tyrosine transposase
MARLTHRTSPGATYFVTTKAWHNVAVFQVNEVAEILIRKLLEYRSKGNYFLHEFVVMPNHLHLILTPLDDISLEKAIQLIKGGSSHEIHRVRESKSQIWQPGFHEYKIRDAADYHKTVSYIHFNPVVARLAASPDEWPFSSANGNFALDPFPQGLKPRGAQRINVGPEGPTPTPDSASRPPKAPQAGAMKHA